MDRHRRFESDDEDEDLPHGVYHEDTPALVACPYCREAVYEEAQYCPRCENFISAEDRNGNAKPVWVWVCLILALLAVLSTAVN